MLRVMDPVALYAAAPGQVRYVDLMTGSTGLRVETDKPFSVGDYVEVVASKGEIRDVIPESEEHRARRLRTEQAEAEREEARRCELETARQTGYLLLSDGVTDAWHGITPDGDECHHRHRSPQAATECARKRSKT
jgi:hypothetical protein